MLTKSLFEIYAKKYNLINSDLNITNFRKCPFYCEYIAVEGIIFCFLYLFLENMNKS